MTATDERRLPQLPAPTRIGQGTAVEMQRAVAEVQGAIFVARQFPRDVTACTRMMRDACGRMALADRAFFRYDRGGDPITGGSVHLARELGRIWGNFQWGIVELRRDDDAGQSEMLAFAWDVETNSRNSTTFIVPHIRDTREGSKLLTDQRDIYENNANNGARRVREMIFGLLPTWFTEEAQQLCTLTLENGDGKPLAERIAECARAFDNLGVAEARLVAKAGRPLAEWTANDVAQMGVIWQSIRRGETTRDAEFEPEEQPLTAAAITGRRRGAAPEPAEGGEGAPDPGAVPPADGDEEMPARPTGAAIGRLGKLLASVPLGTREQVADYLEWVTGHSALEELTRDDVAAVTRSLEDALGEAHGNPEVAAGAIWTAWRADHPDEIADGGAS